MPPGCCVTTAADRSFLADCGLTDTIAGPLADADLADPVEVVYVASSICSRVIGAPMPPAVA